MSAWYDSCLTHDSCYAPGAGFLGVPLLWASSPLEDKALGQGDLGERMQGLSGGADRMGVQEAPGSRFQAPSPRSSSGKRGGSCGSSGGCGLQVTGRDLSSRCLRKTTPSSGPSPRRLAAEAATGVSKASARLTKGLRPLVRSGARDGLTKQTQDEASASMSQLATLSTRASCLI